VLVDVEGFVFIFGGDRDDYGFALEAASIRDVAVL